MSWYELEKFLKLSGCANIIFLRELFVAYVWFLEM